MKDTGLKPGNQKGAESEGSYGKDAIIAKLKKPHMDCNQNHKPGILSWVLF